MSESGKYVTAGLVRGRLWAEIRFVDTRGAHGDRDSVSPATESTAFYGANVQLPPCTRL